MTALADNRHMRRVALTGGALAAFLTAAHIVTDALTSTFTALLPTIQDQFSLSETALAFLVALLSLSSLVAHPFSALCPTDSTPVSSVPSVSFSARRSSVCWRWPRR